MIVFENIGDFGFASQNNCLQTKLGTYPYMAPEFFEGGSYDKAIDVWAIGKNNNS